MRIDWRAKAMTQKALSAVPGGHRINSWLQRAVGGLRDFESNVDGKFSSDWLVMVSAMRKQGKDPSGLSYVEVGTGWYPTLPVCFFLAGARSCVTFDISRLVDEDLTRRMLRRLERHLPSIATASGRPLEHVQADYNLLCSATNIDELLSRARIEYRAPADAGDNGLSPGSVDVCFSNSVLEHITPDALDRIFSDTRRVLRLDGLAIHSVNCGDHYAYFDPRITAINYLAFTESQWRFWNSSLHYQNRLRPRDFLSRARRAGFRIVHAAVRPQPDLLAQLPHLRIAPEFRHYPPEELCATTVDFIAEPAQQ